VGAGLGQGGEWGTGTGAGERRGYRGAGGTHRIGGCGGGAGARDEGRGAEGSRQGRALHASLSAAHPRGRWVTWGARAAEGTRGGGIAGVGAARSAVA
jgi:hypothetical protein